MQAEKEREEETERRKREFEAKKIAVEAQVAVMMSELSAQEKELERFIEEEAAEKKRRDRRHADLARQRHAD